MDHAIAFPYNRRDVGGEVSSQNLSEIDPEDWESWSVYNIESDPAYADGG